jgi:hypothetical protein
MTHRTFRDTAGFEWAVWDVYPIAPERRSTDRRQFSDAGARLVERRRSADRRQHRSPRVSLGSELGRGWLCFEGCGTRRRFAPVPLDWPTWDDSRLAECCTKATPVVRRSTAS